MFANDIVVSKFIVLNMLAVIATFTLNGLAYSQPREMFGPPPFFDEEIIKQYDTDGDGKLSIEELRNIRGNMNDRGFPPPGPDFGGGFGGRGFSPRFEQESLVKKFDFDNDGKLNDSERKSAREYIQKQFGNRQNRFSQVRQASQQKNKVEIEKTFSYDTNADLYDEKVLRTLYLQFPRDDWYEELADFYRSDVEVPADLIVDGIKYPSVGVHFRGNTSYMMASEKKSLNISIDYSDSKQRLYGYKTLNLLNCNNDPSMIREVLYSRICRQYIPAPKANFVKLVINGENWGIYANVQQFNADFTQEWFGTRKGDRWKVPANMRGDGALIWNGDDPAKYKSAYELKTKDDKEVWNSLINLCKVLYETPIEKLEAALNPIFNIEGALWFIAIDNVFMDSDGYISRGSDYNLYRDPQGKFHMIPFDNNETFRYEEFSPGPGRRTDMSPMRDPFIHENNKMRPVISRLLSVPNLRQRYIENIRTLINEWLDWQKVEPIVKEYHALIDAEVKIDDKDQYSYEAFTASLTQDSSNKTPFDNTDSFAPTRDGFENRRGGPGRGGPGFANVLSIKRFIEERREYLLKHPEIGMSYGEKN